MHALVPAELGAPADALCPSTTWKRRSRVETSGTTGNVAGLAIAVLQVEAAPG